MEVIIEDLFKKQFQKCPISFQTQFRKVYQQLRVVDDPLEVKNISVITGFKNFYKLRIEDSTIGMQIKVGKLHIACFLYNPYFEE